MTGKYIDLADRIGEGAEYSNTTSFCLGIECALRWLDEHPEALPGRTITESERNEWTRHMTSAGRGGFDEALDCLGITVVQDPKPPMTAVKSWIEERRGIHTKATPGEWWWEGESNEEWPQSENSLMAGGEPVVNGWGYDASGINVEDNDATYITDALNMFPRALTALEAVIELHRPEAFEDAYSMQSGFMCESCYDPDKNEWVEWPCPTVQAIEGAINE